MRFDEADVCFVTLVIFYFFFFLVFFGVTVVYCMHLFNLVKADAKALLEQERSVPRFFFFFFFPGSCFVFFRRLLSNTNNQQTRLSHKRKKPSKLRCGVKKTQRLS